MLRAASTAPLLPFEGNQVTQRSLLNKDTDARLLKQSIWIPGRYVGSGARIVQVSVVRRSQAAGMYAVKLRGKTRANVDVPTQVLLDFRGLDQNEADIKVRGGSPADALKAEVRDAGLMAAARQKRKTIAIGSKFKHDDGKTYTVFKIYKRKVAARSGKIAYDFNKPHVRKRLL